MEADWDEITRIAVPPSGGLQGLSGPATAIAFDDQQELLWVGNDQGRVTSFHGPELQRYSSVKAHAQEGPVKQLLLHERGVISLASRSLHLTSRRGLTQWHITHPQMTDLKCMTFIQPGQLLLAGAQSVMLVVDAEKGEVVSEVQSLANYTILKKSRCVCAATDDGTVHVLSLPDLEIVKSWKAHATAINDMDARHDYLVTCGFSVRQLGVPLVDPLANVYDLKNLKPLPPIPFHAGAAYIRLHPKLQTTSFVASQTGQLQVIDLMNPVNVVLKHANIQFVLGIEIASSGVALAIIDAQGFLYLWGSPSRVKFNNMTKETHFSDPPPDQFPTVDWNDMALNTTGLPWYGQRLLSSWPSNIVFEIGAPSPQTDPMLLHYLQPAEMGQHAPNLNPRKLFRYQYEDTRNGQIPTSIAAPKFLSEKAKDVHSEELRQNMSEASEKLAAIVINGKPQSDEERMLKYSNVEIKYSRFGVDDFDFKYYNKTPYSGLETHIANSFVNSLLQLYRFVPLIRNVALQHAATSCVTENCFLCEFGFLFDMLEIAAGQNCQATNLLRTFGASRETANLGLFEEATLNAGVPLANTIQSVNRFFLKQMAHDYRLMIGNADRLDDVLATTALEAIRCVYCSNEILRPGNAHVHDLLYPQLDLSMRMHNNSFKFSSILKATIERESKNRGWCNKCKRYQQLAIRKTIHHLPYVLLLNAALVNPAMRVLWETPGWLPSEIGISVQNTAVFCFEGAELDVQMRRGLPNLMVYELVGFVAEIDTGERHQPHLVSLINVDISTPQSVNVQGRRSFPDWHLFNDFLVSPVDPREALHFNKTWKMPSVIAFQVKTAHGAIDESWRQHLDTSLLYHPYSINGAGPRNECHILEPEERPKEGSAIALDTEFVDLEKAEIDIKADGTQETIRPAKSGLARVSVLRGDGENEGIPFIDDYITIHETIVDYKTQYSGINPGDLDTRTSPHNLVPLKVAYKKLWLLLNLGCIFVGHGLASDFRKANIQVPKAQTIDTQYLYLAPGKNRRFSLRYLAWAVFKEYIQEESYDDAHLSIDGHDSIEDARMAMRLWRKFQEYTDAGVAEQMIDEIYRKGSKYGWKPPPRDGVAGALTGVGTGVNSAVVSGRNTPDLNGNATGPSTPVKGFRLSAGSTSTFVPGSAGPRG